MPALIKSYIRLGGKVGLDAFIDHKFNTTDVCLIMDIGGGSIEFIITKGTQPLWMKSFEIGGQRMMEKFTGN